MSIRKYFETEKMLQKLQLVITFIKNTNLQSL